MESGATLEQTSNDVKLAEPMFLEGTGMDAKGAYYASDNTAKKRVLRGMAIEFA